MPIDLDALHRLGTALQDPALVKSITRDTLDAYKGLVERYTELVRAYEAEREYEKAVVETPKRPIGDLWDEYVATIPAGSRRLRNLRWHRRFLDVPFIHTGRRYSTPIWQLTIAKLTPHELTDEMLEDWVEAIQTQKGKNGPLSAGTAGQVCGSLRSMFSHYVRLECLFHNPCMLSHNERWERRQRRRAAKDSTPPTSR